ncbi:MAG: ATP-binding domain-containing protein, partial [Flavobacteriales bacterium]|nr:ATP-binding domain-containing protein [Flavobacteriales bacterium]
VSTIHSLIYNPDSDDTSVGQPTFTLDEKSYLRNADLLILDECSMVNQEIGNDLLFFRRPILVLGDPGQLPPISGTGFFTSRQPDAQLTEVHRQALESPIIRLATEIRKGRPIPNSFNEEGLEIFSKADSKSLNTAEYCTKHDQVMCGTNKTRISVNRFMRKQLGFTDEFPMVGDKVICLRNNKDLAIFNGMMGEVTNVDDAFDLVLSIQDEEGHHRDNIPVHSECFTDPDAIKNMDWMTKKECEEFDFGYCITVHKSQGSEWDSVLLIDDGFLRWDKPQRSKWLYTAVTRAAKKLTIVRN